MERKKERQHTSTKKAVDRNDLSTKSVIARATIVTKILAISLGTESEIKNITITLILKNITSPILGTVKIGLTPWLKRR